MKLYISQLDAEASLIQATKVLREVAMLSLTDAHKLITAVRNSGVPMLVLDTESEAGISSAETRLHEAGLATLVDPTEEQLRPPPVEEDPSDAEADVFNVGRIALVFMALTNGNPNAALAAAGSFRHVFEDQGDFYAAVQNYLLATFPLSQ